jgi:molybdopterin/thiamine biosynthesis adenylyltransferase
MTRRPPRSVRHGRQSRLAEVGPAGQRAIGAATVRVREPGLAGEIEARYLAGAGVGHLIVSEAAHADAALRVDPEVEVEVADPQPAAPCALDLGVLDPACAEVARGAASALASLRSLVQGAAEKHGADGEGR